MGGARIWSGGSGRGEHSEGKPENFAHKVHAAPSREEGDKGE